MRIGLDWGGTKIEAIALGADGAEQIRRRVPTPRDDYQACIATARDLVAGIEAETGETGTVGVGIPGSLSPHTGLVRNANSAWLNGKPLKRDLEHALSRPVGIENDANCFAVSEARDGAAAGAHVTLALILGTGCGAGIAVKGQALSGRQGIAGEFGHTPLPWMSGQEYPGPDCWCGRRGCIETFVSGSGLERDYLAVTGDRLTAAEIATSSAPEARAAIMRYADRLARALAVLIDILDPDVVVLGGGMSNVEHLYERLPALVAPHIFADVWSTPIVKARHGDSSGVRGAAWLWDQEVSISPSPVSGGKTIGFKGG
ncbi:fructokinase [Breoghania corrubedonensis]|uniref:Fructokinase n=1 Tax=Breoghania corrubedonensis TaxID=665038 RepID=A0A2T5V1F8_9HYPH|nr:ROK family protein [Breoghania corrubedonensis]PTW57594.1 fructokinase [Breoghania corrubedonensis]